MPTTATSSAVLRKGKLQGKRSAGKAGPKQPLTLPERLKRLFTSLCAQIDGGHFPNAIKTCDKSAFDSFPSLACHIDMTRISPAFGPEGS